MKSINEKELKQLVSKNNRIVVKFFTTWCGPCKIMSPFFHEASKQNKNTTFYEMDLDLKENSNVASNYTVLEVPTLILFENGKEIKRHSGLLQTEQIIGFIK